jgi:CBS domain-containing protein
MGHIVRDGIFGTYKLVKQSVPLRTLTTVADVMTTGIVTLNPNDSFDAAIELIVKRECHYLVVTDDEQKVLGIISQGDIVGTRWHISEWHSKRVHQIMMPNPMTVTGDTLLSAAISMMISKTLNCLPVVNHSGTLCGMLTPTDIMRSHQEMLEAAEAQRH